MADDLKNAIRENAHPALAEHWFDQNIHKGFNRYLQAGGA